MFIRSDCGSTARKVRRGGRICWAGGRAVRYELHGLTAAEAGQDFDLERWLPGYTRQRAGAGCVATQCFAMSMRRVNHTASCRPM